MTLQHIAVACFSIGIASTAAAGQQPAATSNALVRIDESFRDVNGNWQSTATRTVVSREAGPSGRVDEDTVLRPDLNGRLIATERTITRRSGSDGRDEMLVEAYAPSAWVIAGYDGRLALSHRIRTSTMETADGGRTTIEEVEQPNPAAPGDPVLVTQRTVITVRSLGSNQWVSQREVFERDMDGRMVSVLRKNEQTSGK